MPIKVKASTLIIIMVWMSTTCIFPSWRFCKFIKVKVVKVLIAPKTSCFLCMLTDQASSFAKKELSTVSDSLLKETLWKLLWPTLHKRKGRNQWTKYLKGPILTSQQSPSSQLGSTGKRPARSHGTQDDDGCGNSPYHQRPSIPYMTRRQPCDIIDPLKTIIYRTLLRAFLSNLLLGALEF